MHGIILENASQLSYTPTSRHPRASWVGLGRNIQLEPIEQRAGYKAIQKVHCARDFGCLIAAGMSTCAYIKIIVGTKKCTEVRKFAS
jgi:hypothetical protein